MMRSMTAAAAEFCWWSRATFLVSLGKQFNEARYDETDLVEDGTVVSVLGFQLVETSRKVRMESS